MCLLAQVGGSKPHCPALQSQPLLGAGKVFPVPSKRKSLESWWGIQRHTEEQGTLLALCSCNPTSDALMETSNNPPEVGTVTNTETIPVMLLSSICVGERREMQKG